MTGNKRVITAFVCLSLLGVSCVTHDVSFKAESNVAGDGGLQRTASMQIIISGERETADDSTSLALFYDEHYLAPDTAIFDITRQYHDSVLTFSWTGEIAPGQMPVGDYFHKPKGGSAAKNEISVDVKNRWFYKDIDYRETFSDPVDTAKYFPLIQSGLEKASNDILSRRAFKGMRDTADARVLLKSIENEGGLELFRGLIADPSGLDSLSGIYDNTIAAVSDSLAGFAGVKENPDSLGRLVHNIYDAAWDTLLSDYPGLFGSFRIDDIDIHDFVIEVTLPGCGITSNSDTTVNGTLTWNFSRVDFFARVLTLEASSRLWQWWNVGITVVAVAVILFLIFRPFRKRKVV